MDDRARIGHAKTMILDGAVTLMGSYNWTRGAVNSEDPNLVSLSWTPKMRQVAKVEPCP
jgi:phosphatidylserine/phosphatidylglycerophosphate/cardiolipin synthase-like enzyme